MKKLYILLIAFLTFITLPGLQTEAFDIPLNYGESDNDEAFVQTKNLFDKTNEISGERINPFNGTFVTDALSSRTDYFEILPSTQYTLSGISSETRYALYDSTNTYISGNILSSTDITFTTAANAEYIIISSLTTTFTGTTIQLELGSTATSYAPYGFLSLNDIFVDGNVWDLNASFSVFRTATRNNNDLTITSPITAGSSVLYTDLYQMTNTHKYYSRFNLSIDKHATNIGIFILATGGTNSSSITYASDIQQMSYLYTSDATGAFRIGSSSSITYTANSYFLYELYLLDLTDLGIDHLIQNKLDNLYHDFLTNNIYNQGFIDGEASTEAYASGFDAGYTSGYNTGYSDAVTEDNAYSLGYALGLSEGQDMETGSSIIVLVLAALSFGFMIFGFSSKKRIFNLFAAGLFIALGGLMVEYPAFIIISIGFLIFNIWYTFASD